MSELQPPVSDEPTEDNAGKKNNNFGFFGRTVLNKLENDNDAKVIVIGKNSSTGVGKSTLAIHLCRFVCNHFGKEWNAEENGAYWNVDLYYKHYNDREIPAGSAVLLDEIEAIANRRDWMTRDNKTLIEGWSKLRNRNVFNICTLPSTSQLDKELLRLADYLLIVHNRGWAKPYHIKVNDFTHKLSYQDQPFNGEFLKFSKIPKSDRDYKFIEKMKTEGDSDFELIRKGDAQKQCEKRVKNERTKLRDEFIRQMYRDFDVTYNEIGNLDCVDMTRQTVGQIVRGEQGQ